MTTTWVKREFDPEAMDDVLGEHGMSRHDMEIEAYLKRNRLTTLEDNGWDPFLWEFWRMSVVLDMDMEDLYDRVCPEIG